MAVSTKNSSCPRRRLGRLRLRRRRKLPAHQAALGAPGLNARCRRAAPGRSLHLGARGNRVDAVVSAAITYARCGDPLVFWKTSATPDGRDETRSFHRATIRPPRKRRRSVRASTRTSHRRLTRSAERSTVPRRFAPTRGHRRRHRSPAPSRPGRRVFEQARRCSRFADCVPTPGRPRLRSPPGALSSRRTSPVPSALRSSARPVSGADPVAPSRRARSRCIRAFR